MTIHTTLYDLSAALSAEVGPDEADVVTAAVMHLLNTHRITCTGHRHINLPYRYLGADDRAGPNYTGQPAVCSLYAEQ